MSYVLSRGLWEVARPHMETLVARTHESSSIAQLDGSDIVYVARVAVPKIIALAVTIGTRFLAMQTSLGKVLIAALPPGEAERVLAEPSRSGITPRWQPDAEERAAAMREVRARGWSLTDQELAPGIRSVAAPLRDGDGRTIAALNVTVHASETPVEVLTGEYLPWLLQAAGAISADWAACQGVSQVTIRPAADNPGTVVGVSLDGATSPVPAPAGSPRRLIPPVLLPEPPSDIWLRPPGARLAGQKSDKRTEILLPPGASQPHQARTPWPSARPPAHANAPGSARRFPMGPLGDA